MRKLIRRLIHSPEDGSMSVELVIWAPIMLVVILLLIACGRIALANISVSNAANAAARDASLASDSSTASTNAIQTADVAMSQAGLKCQPGSVVVDATGLDTPIGTTDAKVTAQVTCTLNLSDIAIPGLPGTKTITETATSPVDPYRVRN